MSSQSIEATALVDKDYDKNGWPICAIRLQYKKYKVRDASKAGQIASFEDIPLIDCESWVADYEDLPGYQGEGASIEKALYRLRRDLGPRPHYRVSRPKPKSKEEWRWAIEQKHALRASAGQEGASLLKDGRLVTKSSLAMDEAAKRMGRRKSVAVKAIADFQAPFLPRDDILLISGCVHSAAEELQRGLIERIELEFSVACNTPWRLERLEARAGFPRETADSRGSAF